MESVRNHLLFIIYITTANIPGEVKNCKILGCSCGEIPSIHITKRGTSRNELPYQITAHAVPTDDTALFLPL